MITNFPRRHHALATIATALALAGATAASAQTDGASAWSDDGNAAARLVAGGATAKTAGAPLHAGIEIALKPGWKTYWRYPGDAGTPPRISFARSENVKDVTILWPAPMRFDDGAGGTSIGYTGKVVLPLHVTRSDAAKPATLRADVDYAICEKLCIPVEAKLELPLQTALTAQSQMLRETETLVPRRVPLGASGPLTIASVRRLSEPKPHVVVDVTAPADAKVDLLAEGPTAEWALPLPQPVAGAAAGAQRFAFALDGLPAGASALGATLTLTAIANGQAIEVAAPLD